ncbi:4Fe-4S binding protein [Flavonifractor plautii]|nr:4Fe-4S binding protein [Flavonifractor plautii]
MSMRHSVVLELKRCRGCTTCIKCCPTEAIRVRGRKATILPDRCIDCGSCIRICPHKAIKSVGDSLDILKQYQYCVALPEPALYGQFQHLDSVDIVLNGLLKIGFHKVYEVAKAAEMISDFERQSISGGPSKVTPQISSSCPTVLRLIRMRFPKLMGHVACTILPMELAAILARREAAEETGLPPEAIGVFAIVPCSSKVTAARVSEGLSRPVLDGAFAIRDIYLRLLNPMRELEEITPMASAGILGLGWASCGGESAAHLGERCVAVDGIQNVIRMLEEIEDGRLPEADFLELSACTQGVRRGLLQCGESLRGQASHQGPAQGSAGLPQPFPLSWRGAGYCAEGQGATVLTCLRAGSGPGDGHQQTVAYPGVGVPPARPPLRLCGAPSCRAFAEDVVLGRASEDDCIFKVRERMRSMAGSKEEADDYLPPPFRRRQEPSE